MIAEDQVLDGYRLIRRIGSGGFGDVWLCEPQVMPGVRKALKWVPGAILPKLERELAALIKFQQVSQKLRNANLVPIEHVNRTEEGLFYVMPLADGLDAATPDDPEWRSASLLGLIESHRKANTWFSSQEIIHLMMPVLDALQQLSDSGIVHRDVKPENILLISGQPFLADISLLGEDAIQMTQRGTPGFVAPSWYLESGGHPDQYSAAATQYCLLTGNSPDKMGRSAFRWPPVGEQALNPDERKEWLRLHRVVYRGTHDQHSERFRDFAAMGRELRAKQTSLEKTRGKVPLALAAAAVLAAGIYFVWPIAQISGVKTAVPTHEPVGHLNSPSTTVRPAAPQSDVAAVKTTTPTHTPLGNFNLSSKAATSAPQAAPMRDTATAQSLFKEGMSAYTGEGLVPDIVTAAKCFDKAAKAGYAPAQVMRGLINLDPEKAYDPAKAFYWFQKAAEQGSSAGQYNLGCCFFWGIGAPKNENEAVDWFLKAAEQGFTVAEYAFGYCLITDVSGESDAHQGMPWLFKAAKKGLPEAMYLLGVLAETGDLISRDENSALKWKKAVEAKNYEPDYSKLAAWCDTEGNQPIDTFYQIHDLRVQSYPSDIESFDYLKPHRMESNGNVTFKIENEDISGDTSHYAVQILKAIEKTRELAILRNSEAELWWGKNLVNGIYLEKNPKLALAWLRRAAEHGNSDAKKWMITAIQNLNATPKR